MSKKIIAAGLILGVIAIVAVGIGLRLVIPEPVAATQAAAIQAQNGNTQARGFGQGQGGNGQGQQADNLAHMQHHDHRAQRGAGGHAEQVGVGQRVTCDCLQHCANQR